MLWEIFTYYVLLGSAVAAAVLTTEGDRILEVRDDDGESAFGDILATIIEGVFIVITWPKVLAANLTDRET